MQSHTPRLLIIGEGLHTLNSRVRDAILREDEKTLTEIAKHQVEGGATALDVNFGPEKTSPQKTEWVIQTLQTAAPVPLFLSAHVLRHPDSLGAHRGRATINAVTADPAQLAGAMAAAKEHGSNLVVLLARPGMLRSGVEERLLLATDVLSEAIRIGLDLERLYLDPVLTVRPDPVSWRMSRGMPDLDPAIELISLIRELGDDRMKTILALSSGTPGLSGDQRSALHCRMLRTLADAGLSAVIMNCADSRLAAAARDINRADVNRKAA